MFEFFCYFFWNFHPRAEFERNAGLKFFFLFFGLSIPVLAKNNAGKRFFSFLTFFFLFFLEFSCTDRIGTEFGSNFYFFHIFGLSHPILAKNNAGKGFFNFLNFFSYLFRNFLARDKYERNSWLNFFLSLSRPISFRFG